MGTARTDDGTAGKAVVVEGLTKSFGSFHALRGISFEVGRGEILGLLGPNGAGKTTTVDILSTLSKPDAGRAVVAGHDVATDPAAVRRSIMLTGQHAALDDMLSGRENLVMFGRLQGLRKSDARARAGELIDQFDLAYAANRRVGTYSGGMRRRIDIACGLVVRPEVVFLDEPTTGLDPRSRQGVWDLVSQFRDAGIATLLTTQYLEEADTLSDRIVVIDHGKVIAEGTADQLKERTGATYCEIVPRHRADLPAVIEALGALVPEHSRAVDATSDRVAIPAPDGTRTLVAAVARLDAVGVELMDIALRRPSLDEVFFALTGDTPRESDATESSTVADVPVESEAAAATPESGEPGAPDEPKADATSAGSETAEPETAESEAAEPETAVSETAVSEAAEPETAEPEQSGPATGELSTVDVEVAS